MKSVLLDGVRRCASTIRVYSCASAFLLLALVTTSACQPIQSAAPAAPAMGTAQAASGTVVIKINDEGITAPETVPAGLANVVYRNSGQVPHVIELDWLGEGVNPTDAFAAPPLGIPDQIGAYTVVFLEPGAQVEAVLDFGAQPQYIAYEIFVENPSYAVMAASGDSGITEAPPADVNVDLVNFAFVMPDPIPAGVTWWQLNNKGTQQHEVSLHQLNDEYTADMVKEELAAVDANGQVPPAVSAIPAFMVGVGKTVWVKFDLPEGDYLAVCDVPDFSTLPPGEDHWHLGMFREFAVTP